MTLYHFCCEKDAKGIQRNGINLGTIVIEHGGNKRTFHTGWQWLTTDPDPAHQSWNTHHLLRYDRTAYRFTLEIPEKEAEARVFDRFRLKEIMPEADYLFEGWPGSENWRVYKGHIRESCIVAVERMES